MSTANPTEREEHIIRTKRQEMCCVCGSEAEPLYDGLNDRLFGASGTWNIKRCTSADCGLLWLDPMPIAEDIGKAYADYYTHQNQGPVSDSWRQDIFRRIRMGYAAVKYGYVSKETSWLDRLLGSLGGLHPERRESLNLRHFYLDASLRGRLLEIGCGNGTMLEYMHGLGWEVEGIDFDPSAVQLARDKGLTVHLGDLSDHSFVPDSFDAIVMSHVIEHVADPVALLMECKRLLRSDGRVVIVTPNTESLGHQLYGRDWRGLEPPRHLHLFSPATLRLIANKVGLQQVMLKTSVRNAGDIFTSSRAVRRWGRYDWRMTSTTGERLRSAILAWIEAALLLFRPYAGEELVWILTKSGTTRRKTAV